jgi:suppressor of fused-like protein
VSPNRFISSPFAPPLPLGWFNQALVVPNDDWAPGWDAIDLALKPTYGDQIPLHWGTAIPRMLGGPDPIDGISAYLRSEPVSHWHFVTYGFPEVVG